jgi:hypothetical protein
MTAETKPRGIAVNRRDLIVGAVSLSAALGSPGATAGAATTKTKSAHPKPAADGATIHVGPRGLDTNVGTKDSPLLTLAEAARRVSAMEGAAPITVIVGEGVYAMAAEAHFTPTRRQFTKTARLTIRAEVLPDDPAWNFGRMPTLIHTIALEPQWNGRPISNGKTANGIVVGASHMTIQGLKILGAPVVETPVRGEVNRIYPIGRFDGALDDLEITQCFFGGDEVTAPNHLPIIANGTGMVIDHCIFYRTKLSVVWWHVGSTGHAMRNCLLYGCYQGGPWTAVTAGDFDFRNNVVAECKNVWIQGELGAVDADAAAGVPGANGRAFRKDSPPTDGRYRVVDSLFANNGRLAVSGTGSNLDFKDIDAGFLTFVNTKVTEEPVMLVRDEWSRRYLHPLPGSEAAAIGAGLFRTPA